MHRYNTSYPDTHQTLGEEMVVLSVQVLERLDSGYRLPPPPGTPRAIYELMIKAW